MTMRLACIVMRGMSTSAIRPDRPDSLRSARPSASGPARPRLGGRVRAPVSAGARAAVRVAPERRAVPLPRGPRGDGGRIRVAIVGATGYVGAELVRLLTRHPDVEIVGLVGRGRNREPIGGTHIHLDRTGLHVDATVPDADAVFLALPHGAAAEIVPDLAATGAAIIDLGPDFRLRAARRLPALVRLRAPAGRTCSPAAVYGLPELHRAALAALRRREDRDRRGARLLPHGHPPRPGSPRPGRADRRPRRRREVGRLGRRARAEAGPHVRRGQREREGVRRSAAIATSPRWSRSWLPSASTPREPGTEPPRTRAPATSTSSPTSSR